MWHEFYQIQLKDNTHHEGISVTTALAQTFVAYLFDMPFEMHVNTLSSFAVVSLHVFSSKSQECVHTHIQTSLRLLHTVTHSSNECSIKKQHSTQKYNKYIKNNENYCDELGFDFTWMSTSEIFFQSSVSPLIKPLFKLLKQKVWAFIWTTAIYN